MVTLYFLFSPPGVLVGGHGRKALQWVSAPNSLGYNWCDYVYVSISNIIADRLCGLVVRVLDYRCRGPGFDSRALPEKKVVGLERGPLSLMSTTEELLDRKVAAPV
jgi:hypothetical protein